MPVRAKIPPRQSAQTGFQHQTSWELHRGWNDKDAEEDYYRDRNGGNPTMQDSGESSDAEDWLEEPEEAKPANSDDDSDDNWGDWGADGLTNQDTKDSAGSWYDRKDWHSSKDWQSDSKATGSAKKPPWWEQWDNSSKAHSSYSVPAWQKERDEAKDWHKEDDWNWSWNSREMEQIKKQKAKLPIRAKQAEVVKELCGPSSVCCLVGETGSGKSTQVPQMLLEESCPFLEKDKAVRVVVSQPRRVAALNLAKRVAKEMGEHSIGGAVGYRIGGESQRGTSIDFCTVGYLLQLFLNKPDELGEYTHVVLDEVHERSAESDLLCLVVKLIISHRFPKTRVVVMSATLQSDLFINYFTLPEGPPPSKVFISTGCFPVVEYFLEDFAATFGGTLKTANLIQQKIRDVFPPKAAGSDDAKGRGKGGGSKGRTDPRHIEKFHSIVMDVIEAIAKPASTILIFLPGIAEISALWEEAKVLEERLRVRVFPFHSMIPREEQELVFVEPDSDTTHVVLATDIAESSITLPNVVAVIDLGLHRRVDYNQAAGMSALATKWISRAAAKQRCGRAGRTQPGMCLRIYTKEFFQDLPEFEAPESASMPLDRLYLQAKQLAQKLTRVLETPGLPSTAEGLLEKMVQAPPLVSIGAARARNADLGVITVPTEGACITSLGRLCLQVTVDPRLVRLIWFGCLMGVAADAVVLASVLSSMDPFSAPTPLFMREESVFMEKLRTSTSARLLFDGGSLSEPLMHRQLFLEWLVQFHTEEWVCGSKEQIFQARRRHTSDFALHFSLHRGRMEHLVSQVLDLSLRVYRACAPESQAAKSLLGLIRGLGYVINKRGDLSGMSWEDWRNFDASQVFEENTAYLKAVLAMAFGDELFVGGYGSLPNVLELPAEADTAAATPASAPPPPDHLKVEKALLLKMNELGLDVRHTIVFGEKCGLETDQDIEDYVEFVCQERAASKPVKVKAEQVDFSLVSLKEADGSRWTALQSRPELPLLECPRRLPAEFQLFSSTERCLKDLQKARSMASGWRFGAVPARHPTILHWEWMKHSSTTRSQLLRTEGNFQLRNPTGCIGHLPAKVETQQLSQIAALAVASSLAGSESGGRLYPSGVTKLCPGHIPFLLAAAKLEDSAYGFHKFGFTTTGSFTVLHRCLRLPKDVVNRERWASILQLREALRAELQVPEELWEDSWNAAAPTFTKNSQVAAFGRALFKAVKCDEAGDEAPVDPEFDCRPREAIKWTINLADEKQEGLEAFQPLAPWALLTQRRQQLRKEGGRAWTWPKKHYRPRSPLRQVFDLPKKARKEEAEATVIGENREPHSSQDVSSMTLDELTRQAFRLNRCVTSISEKRRLLQAFKAACKASSPLSNSQKDAVEQRMDKTEDTLRSIPKTPASGRDLFLHVLKELEHRLQTKHFDEEPRRSRSTRQQQQQQHQNQRSRSRSRRRRDPSRRARSHRRDHRSPAGHRGRGRNSSASGRRRRRSRSRSRDRRHRSHRSRSRERNRNRSDRDRSGRDRVREKAHVNVQNNFSSTPTPAVSSEAPRRRFTESSSAAQAQVAGARDNLPRASTASRSRDASRPARNQSPHQEKRQETIEIKIDSEKPASVPTPPPIVLPDAAEVVDLEEKRLTSSAEEPTQKQKETCNPAEAPEAKPALSEDADPLIIDIQGNSSDKAQVEEATTTSRTGAGNDKSPVAGQSQAEDVDALVEKQTGDAKAVPDNSQPSPNRGSEDQTTVDVEMPGEGMAEDAVQCEVAQGETLEAALPEGGAARDELEAADGAKEAVDPGEAGPGESAMGGESVFESLSDPYQEGEGALEGEETALEGQASDQNAGVEAELDGDDADMDDAEEQEQDQQDQHDRKPRDSREELVEDLVEEQGDDEGDADAEAEGEGEGEVELDREGEGEEEEDAEEDEEVEWVEGFHPWVKVWDPNNNAYYYHNEETGESMWEHPSTISTATGQG